jgi:hypothetical protein
VALGTQWQVGQGDKVSFWHDKWLGDLDYLFPSLFLAPTNQEISAAEAWQQGSWNVQFAGSEAEFKSDKKALFYLLHSTQITGTSEPA